MLNPVRPSQFRKGLRKAKRQGKDLNRLQSVVLALANQTPLEEHLCDHELPGTGEAIASAT